MKRILFCVMAMAGVSLAAWSLSGGVVVEWQTDVTVEFTFGVEVEDEWEDGRGFTWSENLRSNLRIIFVASQRFSFEHELPRINQNFYWQTKKRGFRGYEVSLYVCPTEKRRERGMGYYVNW